MDFLVVEVPDFHVELELFQELVPVLHVSGHGLFDIFEGHGDAGIDFLDSGSAPD